ncbi:MAG TPA: aminopeptidase [Syntrophorhabdaceae bacterium]|nr:aminopeptidase [Syntrophorhabdaceae bacterium]HQM81637.1 aminopeptidase [Syntrophorhabdaceae bacterium]
MLTDKQLEQYADVLLWGLETARKKLFKKNDCILLQYEAPAVRLAEILYGRILDLGMHPVQRMGLTFGMEKGFYERSNRKQLTFLAPGDRELYSNLNGRIFLRAPESLTHLKEVDPAKIGTVLVSRKPLRDILDKREEKGLYSWTLCTFPTAELASQAKASPEEYTRQIIRACYLDRKDPVAEWKNVHQQVGGIKKWLNSLKVSYFHIESGNVDLKVTPGERRRWKGISGHNIPSFEVFLSPDWHGTEGVYYANLPSFRSGNYVEKIRITFRKGSVVEMEAAKGEDFARKQLAMDKGAAKVGEFSLTDRRFSRIDRFMADTLFDENFGGQYGNCHIALGASYTDTYDGNPAAMTGALKKKLGFNDSALHWDLVNTEDKTVTACLRSGKKVVIYEKGVFKY